MESGLVDRGVVGLRHKWAHFEIRYPNWARLLPKFSQSLEPSSLAFQMDLNTHCGRRRENWRSLVFSGVLVAN